MPSGKNATDETLATYPFRSVIGRVDPPRHVMSVNVSYWNVECACGHVRSISGPQMRANPNAKCKKCCFTPRGPSAREARILGMLCRSDMQVSDVASELQVSNRETYRTLMRMMQKGMVSRRLHGDVVLWRLPEASE